MVEAIGTFAHALGPLWLIAGGLALLLVDWLVLPGIVTRALGLGLSLFGLLILLVDSAVVVALLLPASLVLGYLLATRGAADEAPETVAWDGDAGLVSRVMMGAADSPAELMAYDGRIVTADGAESRGRDGEDGAAVTAEAGRWIDGAGSPARKRRRR